jgi:hypothetical protein
MNSIIAAAAVFAVVTATLLAVQAPAGGGGGGAAAAPAAGGAQAPAGAPAAGAARGGGGRGGGRGAAAPAVPAGPTPRLSNGKPDLSGHWNNPYTSDMAARGSVVDPTTHMPITFARQGETFPSAPPMANGNRPKTFDLPYTAYGLKHWLDYDPVHNGDYTGNCLPFGFSRSINAPRGLQIIQNNDSISLMFEQNSWFVWIPTDGKKWPENYPEAWNGLSTGHWDGDTLVIETDRFNGYTRLDTAGHPHSKGLKIITTLLRTDSNTIQHTVTIHDPKAYTQDWTNVRRWTLQPATNFIMEYACEENNVGAYDGSITAWKRPTDEELEN